MRFFNPRNLRAQVVSIPRGLMIKRTPVARATLAAAWFVGNQRPLSWIRHGERRAESEERGMEDGGRRTKEPQRLRSIAENAGDHFSLRARTPRQATRVVWIGGCGSIG